MSVMRESVSIIFLQHSHMLLANAINKHQVKEQSIFLGNTLFSVRPILICKIHFPLKGFFASL